MSDQPWVSDPVALQQIRDRMAEAMAAADRQQSAGPDPNADLLKQVNSDLITAFRASNPEIYDRLSREFNAQFRGAVREGVRMGMNMAVTVVEGVVTSAEADNDVSPAGHAYLEALPKALRAVADKMQKELGE